MKVTLSTIPAVPEQALAGAALAAFENGIRAHTAPMAEPRFVSFSATAAVARALSGTLSPSPAYPRRLSGRTRNCAVRASSAAAVCRAAFVL